MKKSAPIRSESESLHSASRSPIQYNRRVTAENFAVIDLPPKRVLLQMLNVTKNDRLRPNGTTVNQIFAEIEYTIRGCITECATNSGDGSRMDYPRMAPYLAQKFLIKLWYTKRDASTKITMTNTEIYKRNIGRTLNAFRERIKNKIRESSLRLVQLPGTAKHDTIAMTNYISYQNNTAF